ncbi:uncharacterized protein LOC131607640 [Vicia villosa]|uniref:uncharacterized protein LOC131607640 n=1 Tax=Vicia villosa TaxID=3911 RepID=UPI00273CBBA6|nr:uncharacterized protein LOC131607640 [Vicia villosa]
MSFSRNSVSNPNSGSSSVRSRRVRKCGCEARMVSYICKNGRNKGRLFWRCPFWQSGDTCDLFIWDEDMVEDYGVGVESVDVNKLKELETVELMREMYQASKKKNMKLQAKLKSEALARKIKMMLLLVSLMINVLVLSKCN